MSYLVYAIARIFIPILFIVSGWSKLTNVAPVAQQIGGLPIAFPPELDSYLPIPRDEFLAYVVGAVEFFGGIMIVLGLKARWAALALFVFTALATFYFHNFWDLADAAQAMAQRAQALKNLSVMGGLLMVVVMGSGAYSLDHPTPRALAGR